MVTVEPTPVVRMVHCDGLSTAKLHRTTLSADFLFGSLLAGRGGGGLAIGSELVAYMIIVFSLEMGTLIGIREIWHVDCELSPNADVGSQIIMPGTEHRFSRGGQVGATCGDSSKLSAMQIFKVDY